MAKRNIAKELIQGLEEVRAWQRGEAKLRTSTVELPKAEDVPEIRRELGYSQAEFAAVMGVSVGTLRNWEQLRRQPQGAARTLLLVASTHPEAIRKSMEKLLQAKRAKRLVKSAALAKRVRQARTNKGDLS